MVIQTLSIIEKNRAKKNKTIDDKHKPFQLQKSNH